MPDQAKLDFEVSVSTRLPASSTRELDDLALRNYTDRSKTLRAVFLRWIEIVKQQGSLEQSLGDLLRRMRLDPA